MTPQFKVGGRQVRTTRVQRILREEDELAHLVPTQLTPDAELTPGQKLCLGILHEAFVCLRGYSSDMPDGTGWEAFWRRRYRSMREAERWLADDAQNRSLSFTFRRCCEVLGYEPTRVRQAMLNKRKINPRLMRYIVIRRWTLLEENHVEG
jgi:hypothetical protein